jgi:hypothetical protein
MTTGEAERCLSNNLDWYRSVLAPHGLAGTIADGLWTCRGHVPPYYSNAITVSPDGQNRQHRALADLAAALGRPFAVKDSFANLDLEPLGFRMLFDAAWIWRDPSDAPPADAKGWQRVTTPDGLDAWEAAWAESGSPAERRVFLPALLADEAVALFALYEGSRIVAGCAANRSRDCLGLSNVFSAVDVRASIYPAAAGAVAAWAPGLALAGYESGEALATARGCGFRAVGPLRVWGWHGDVTGGGAPTATISSR